MSYVSMNHLLQYKHSGKVVIIQFCGYLAPRINNMVITWKVRCKTNQVQQVLFVMCKLKLKVMLKNSLTF